jgi:hypothetical protein
VDLEEAIMRMAGALEDMQVRVRRLKSLPVDRREGLAVLLEVGLAAARVYNASQAVAGIVAPGGSVGRAIVALRSAGRDVVN